MILLQLAPDLLKELSSGSRSVLDYTFFKIGPMPVTSLFAIKVGVFLFLLITVSHLLQRVLTGKTFKQLRI